MGVLPDGTGYFAPPGQLLYDRDRDRVCCHLCGAWLKRISPGHLERVHGWGRGDYTATFGLNRTAPLQTPTLSARQAEVLADRLGREQELACSVERAKQRMRMGEVSPVGTPRSLQARNRISQAKSEAAKYKAAEGRRKQAAAAFAAQQQQAAWTHDALSFEELYARLRAQGLSLHKIAQLVGRDESWVERTPARLAERAFSEQPSASAALSARLNALAHESGAANVGDYLRAKIAAGATAKQLLHELGVAQKTLQRLLASHGIPGSRRRRDSDQNRRA